MAQPLVLIDSMTSRLCKKGAMQKCKYLAYLVFAVHSKRCKLTP